VPNILDSDLRRESLDVRCVERRDQDCDEKRLDVLNVQTRLVRQERTRGDKRLDNKTKDRRICNSWRVLKVKEGG
jgi:hypothetical protein